jgi:glutamate-1-semialdehyde 2,1-aminomutase
MTPRPGVAEVYRTRTPKSAALMRRAARVLPGGNTRTATHYPPHPIVLASGKGARVTDVDGNDYLDLLNNYTSLIHGHAYPPAVEAAARASSTGSVWPGANLPQIELAELLTGRLPSADQVRFTNSGTEAGALALKLARRLTGRRKVLKAAFGYHGSEDTLEAGMDGQPGPDTYLAPYNDLAAFQAILDEHGEEIAAVFVEPLLSAGGVIRGSAEFLTGLQAATRQAGALFVLDEVVTLRLAVGGLQAELGLCPDVTMLGKLIGGGYPVGALAGPAEILAAFDPTSGPARVFHAGTFNGNPVTCAAGAATVRDLTDAAITDLARRGAWLAEQLEKAAASLELPLTVRQQGSLLALHFSSGPTGPGDRGDAATLELFHLAGINHGVLSAPRGQLALSTALTDERLADAAERLTAALGDVRTEARAMA